VKRTGQVLLALVFVTAIAAPWLAPNAPERRFEDLLYAPPTIVHVLGNGGPRIYPWRLVSRLERRFEEDRSRPVALRWFTRDGLVTGDADRGAPLLLLGADRYGRDTFSRLLYGSRITLALAGVSAVAALLLGALIGGLAGYAGGTLDQVMSRFSEFIIVLPTIYVALALRSVMPLILPASTIFLMLTVIFALLGWPVVARGVRAIVASERQRDYVAAARALGASPSRVLIRHLLPSARGYIATQATLLLPAFILAEATMSYVGLGFPDTTPTWGTMLEEAANVALLGDAPWPLAPAVAIFVVVLAVNLVVQGGGRAPVQLEP
jgi:peptide/nickel transport system permease protein